MPTLFRCIFQVVFFIFIASVTLEAHEGHHAKEEIVQSEEHTSPSNNIDTTATGQIIRRLGSFHPVILHFPIALIVMTVVSELLFLYYKNPLFDHASRFMIFAAAIFAIPTALLGLAYAYGAHYEGALVNYLWWHRSLGLFTALLTVLTVILRELHTRKQWNTITVYAICLAILFISVNIATYLGGEMTFGSQTSL